MARVSLKEVLNETCAWCPLAYCHDDCGVKAIFDNCIYEVNTRLVDLKED